MHPKRDEDGKTINFRLYSKKLEMIIPIIPQNKFQLKGLRLDLFISFKRKTKNSKRGTFQAYGLRFNEQERAGKEKSQAR